MKLISQREFDKMWATRAHGRPPNVHFYADDNSQCVAVIFTTARWRSKGSGSDRYPPDSRYNSPIWASRHFIYWMFSSWLLALPL